MILPSQADFIYLAGIVDGEGCIRVNNAPRLHITNTSQILIEWLVDRFGGYVWVQQTSFVDNNKPRFQWEVSARQCEAILQQIVPFLVIKKLQAQLVLDYYSEGVSVHGGAQERRATLKERLHMLNKKGWDDASQTRESWSKARAREISERRVA